VWGIPGDAQPRFPPEHRTPVALYFVPPSGHCGAEGERSADDQAHYAPPGGQAAAALGSGGGQGVLSVLMSTAKLSDG
jgi:hypothetical protein